MRRKRLLHNVDCLGPVLGAVKSLGQQHDRPDVARIGRLGHGQLKQPRRLVKVLQLLGGDIRLRA